jgi:hypothetical protein
VSKANIKSEAQTKPGTIQPGTTVTWAVGVTGKKREGVVIAFIPAGVEAQKVYPALLDLSSGQYKLGENKSGFSKHDRYLVRVDRKTYKRTVGVHKTSTILMYLPSHWYAPKVSAVTVVGKGKINGN